MLSLAGSSARSRLSLQLEVAALRQQLSAYQAEGRKPEISSANRLLWSFVSKCWSEWRSALCFVQPRTVTIWQKKRFRDYWRRLSQGRGPGRPKIAPELRQLIRRMWQANPTWGAPRIVRFNVTEHPTAQWTAQQLTEAFPFDTAPRYLIRDGDGRYGHRVRRRIRSLGIGEFVTAPASRWQNPFVERVIGSIRRELLDHVVILSERPRAESRGLYHLPAAAQSVIRYRQALPVRKPIPGAGTPSLTAPFPLPPRACRSVGSARARSTRSRSLPRGDSPCSRIRKDAAPRFCSRSD